MHRWLQRWKENRASSSRAGGQRKAQMRGIKEGRTPKRVKTPPLGHQRPPMAPRSPQNTPDDTHRLRSKAPLKGECSGCVESNLIYLVKTDTSFVPCVPCSPKKQLRVFIKDHHRTVWCHPTVEEYRGACRRSQRVRFTLQPPPSTDPLNPLQQGLAVPKELKARRQTQTGSTRRGAQARRI